MRDEWSIGFGDAVDLRHSVAARERLLVTVAPSWSRERLDGFLHAHELALNAQRCTCSSCPLHSSSGTAGPDLL